MSVAASVIFVRESTCAHAMALEMALDGMVPVADPVC